MPRVHLTAIKVYEMPGSASVDLGTVDPDSPFLVVRIPKGAEAVTPEAMHAAFDGLAPIVIVVPDGYELHWARCVDELQPAPQVEPDPPGYLSAKGCAAYAYIGPDSETVFATQGPIDVATFDAAVIVVVRNGASLWVAKNRRGRAGTLSELTIEDADLRTRFTLALQPQEPAS